MTRVKCAPRRRCVVGLREKERDREGEGERQREGEREPEKETQIEGEMSQISCPRKESCGQELTKNSSRGRQDFKITRSAKSDRSVGEKYVNVFAEWSCMLINDYKSISLTRMFTNPLTC